MTHARGTRKVEASLTASCDDFRGRASASDVDQPPIICADEHVFEGFLRPCERHHLASRCPVKRQGQTVAVAVREDQSRSVVQNPGLYEESRAVRRTDDYSAQASLRTFRIRRA
jgi:hypothetical protein